MTGGDIHPCSPPPPLSGYAPGWCYRSIKACHHDFVTTASNVDYFPYPSLTDTVFSKFAAKWSLKIFQRLKYIALCYLVSISVSFLILIQVNAVMCLKWGRIFNNEFCQISCWVCHWRILKIGQYFVMLWPWWRNFYVPPSINNNW